MIGFDGFDWGEHPLFAPVGVPTPEIDLGPDWMLESVGDMGQFYYCEMTKQCEDLESLWRLPAYGEKV